MSYEKLIIYSDGGARGNPGPAGIGALLYDQDKKEIARVSRYIGRATNNQAEYQAILAGLEKAAELGCAEVECFLDSELIVRQLNGQYKVKNLQLQPLFLMVHNLRQKFRRSTFIHIRRELNKAADALANQAMDSFADKDL